MHTLAEIAAPEIAMALALIVAKLAGQGHHIDRLTRCARILRRDARIPALGKLLLTLAVVPIPGPVDEILATLAAGILFARKRSRLAVVEAWNASAA